ncbi:DNA methyltransferase [Pontibacillus yanchengensis]|uniref:DNA methyltransferase n=2 Tax=Pontibacillus yanchengensis TaxID=462910 RepID=A0ACC7VM53_9BACI|nr:MGMT family protein [Pontibacillus yanchengensis]MYL33706.1 DNA methyltransferase [Pontibacillus yanchengensis]MYL55396.1 DNA methyltransferase [Pontibacillus yanchengensis]
MKLFTENVVNIILSIPSGKVMTYGQISKLAGNPRGARQVVRILHTMGEKYKLPWHRVINAKGEIGIKDEGLFMEQKISLEEEGIVFLTDKKIDLSTYQYNPKDGFGE